MKKLFALLLAIMMVFSMATVAFADEEDQNEPEELIATSNPNQTVDLVLRKLYEVNGAEGDTVPVPLETLSFTSTPAATNPGYESAANPGPNLTIADLSVTEIDGEMSITLPTYNQVGEYKYTIKETAGNTQGVTYSTQEIYLTVLVTYDYDDTVVDDGYGLATQIVLSSNSVDTGSETTGSPVVKDNGEETVYKLDTFTNIYDLGSLSVSKSVEGNLASQDAYFDFKVLFISEKPIESDIVVSGGSRDDNPTAVVWTETTTGSISMYTATVNFKLKHDETFRFDNIPVGVTYTVTEDVKHMDTNGVVDPNSDADKEYTVSYKFNDEEAVSSNLYSGDIAKDDADTVAYTNEKSTSVDTGIALDSMPYIMMLVAAVVGMAVVIGKKRYEV